MKNKLPLSIAEPVDCLPDVPVEKIREFEEEFLNLLELKHKNILNTLKEGKLNEEIEKNLTDIAKEIVEQIK